MNFPSSKTVRVGRSGSYSYVVVAVIAFEKANGLYAQWLTLTVSTVSSWLAACIAII